MRIRACVGLLLLSLTLTGCSGFGKKSSAGPRPAFDLNAAPNNNNTPANEPRPAALTTSAGSGLLAGQVIDNFNRRPPAAYIQVAAVREGNEPTAAPIDVSTDSDGYFTIQGLQPGRHYQLVARARDGAQLLAGTTFATPPNPRVVIRISPELATASIPPLPALGGLPSPPPVGPVGGSPPAPTVPGPVTTTPGPNPAPTAPRPPAAWPPGPPHNDRSWAPGRNQTPAPKPHPPAYPTPPDRPANLGAPIGLDGDPPQPAVRPRPESVATAEPHSRPDTPLVIPNAAALPPTPPPIPFCSLNGRQLDNFGLHDLNRQPWEFRKRNNRLTLVDFWGTWCVYCMHAIPHLNILQERYGQYGLEVVGIAYENGPPQNHADQVRRVAGRLNVNYTLLLGGDRVQCPVRTQFRVASWPSFFLIEQSGRIIWQDVGLDRQKFAELERIVRHQLGVR